jgi:DNA-binding transcriptional ArsR family regulator
MNVDVLNQPLRSVAIYNPARLLSKQELIDQFVVRTSLLHSLLDDLRRVGPGEPAQHYLLVGQRGMGKTTLLRRLRYAVEDDIELDAVWLPLDFPEEQYNVARLSDLYVNWLDALSDALQTRGNAEDAERLDAAVDALPGDEEERAAQALRMLIDEAERLGHRLLLLIDNIDLVLDRLKDEHWEIRKVLAAETSLTVIGASSQAIEATYQYDQAFYDFFQIHDSARPGRSRHAPSVGAIGRTAPDAAGSPPTGVEDPGRLPTLHVLAGGNPRTVVLLYEVLASGGNGNVRTDLDRLLDQHTPLYKSRFESLSAQAQQIVDALAIHWHPITAADLSAIVRLPVNAVSAQLDRLVKQGLVEKVAYYEPESRAGFQIAERFFNIWYLMRASRRVRRKLIWLVEFLRLYHGPDGLRHNAQRYLHDEPPTDLAEAEQAAWKAWSWLRGIFTQHVRWRRS